VIEKLRAMVARHPLYVVAAFAILSTAARLFLAHWYYGFQTGDDLEIAEEAFRVAVGLKHHPWAIRSVFIPDLLVAPFVAVSHAVGLRDPLLLATIARYPFIVLCAVNILLVFQLGRRWYDEMTGLVATGLYAAHWMPLVYGSSLYPRTVAVTCILGAALLLGQRGSIMRPVLAGALAALALTSRYSEAVFCGSLLIAGEWNGRWRRGRLLAFLASFAACFCVVIGFHDRLTWGRWFGSLIEFAELVFIRHDASSVVVNQPPWWYVSNLLHWIAASLLPFLAIALRRGELQRALAFVVLPLLGLSVIFHKELRYLQVLVPFVLLLAARGFVLLWREQPNRRRVAALLLLLAVPLGLARIGVVERRSTNAVMAALWIAERSPAAVALSQPWAYGGRLFLGNDVEITEVGIPLDLGRVRQEAPRVAFMGVFSSDVNDALRSACREGGLSEAKTFEDRGGRAVTVFSRSAVPRSRR
jgi:hypothetical protein